MEQSKLMARLAYQALDDKKGEDIQVIDISQVSVLADYFIIANGNSESQVRDWQTTWKKNFQKPDMK